MACQRRALSQVKLGSLAPMTLVYIANGVPTDNLGEASPSRSRARREERARRRVWKAEQQSLGFDLTVEKQLQCLASA
jgi:hypothetical protein